MTTTETPASTVRPAAQLLAWGTFVTIIGGALLLAAGYAGATTEVVYQGDADGSITLAVIAWIVLGLGAALLSAGVLRAAQHADRAAATRSAVEVPVEALDEVAHLDGK